MTLTMSKQQLAAIARVAASVLVSVYGVLTAATVAPHLPAWCAGIMVAFGPAMIVLQHWLSDPSTGNPTPVAPAPPAAQ